MTTAIAHPPGHHVNVRGHRLWVEEEGQGEPVLLLSGFGPAGSHLTFHPHFSALADSYRVFYCDLYGRGNSERPTNLSEITVSGDVADVAELVANLKTGPVHVYGFSYGGLIAQELALSFPQLIRTITLANTLHSPEMWQLNHANINRELANQYPEVWSRILELRREGVPSTDPRMQQEFAVAARLVRFFNPDNANMLLSEPGSRNIELYSVFCGADVDFIIGGQLPAIPDFRPRLKGLKVPLLILGGRYDRALYPQLQQQFLEFAPQARSRISRSPRL
jgi:proline iminopeptidase